MDTPGLFFPNEYETVLEIRKLIAVHPHEVRNSVHSASIGKEGSGRLFGKSRPSLKLIKSLSNFGGLVLGCIEADVSK